MTERQRQTRVSQEASWALLRSPVSRLLNPVSTSSKKRLNPPLSLLLIAFVTPQYQQVCCKPWPCPGFIMLIVISNETITPLWSDQAHARQPWPIVTLHPTTGICVLGNPMHLKKCQSWRNWLFVSTWSGSKCLWLSTSRVCFLGNHIFLENWGGKN